jgi:hypothetical protein
LAANVFISHADNDASLANKLTDLLLVGLGLKAADVFCTSLAGLGIPAGQDFKGYIRKELADSTVVIALLSPNYYASTFCLCEAGSTWVLAKDFIPFVVELSTFSEMKAVLQATQALRLNEETASAWRVESDAGRFSLAGAQPKTALLFDGKRWGVPSRRTPSAPARMTPSVRKNQVCQSAGWT